MDIFESMRKDISKSINKFTTLKNEDLLKDIMSIIENNQYKIANNVEYQTAYDMFQILFEGDFDSIPEDIKEDMINDYLDNLKNNDAIDESKSILVFDVIDRYIGQIKQYT